MNTFTRFFASTLIIGISFLFITDALAQDNVGIGTTTPHPNAILHIESPASSDPKKGLLIPRMSILDRLGIADPPGTFLPPTAQGLLVYDTDLQEFCYWNAGILPVGDWSCFGLGGGGGNVGPIGPQGDPGLPGLPGSPGLDGDPGPGPQIFSATGSTDISIDAAAFTPTGLSIAFTPTTGSTGLVSFTMSGTADVLGNTTAQQAVLARVLLDGVPIGGTTSVTQDIGGSLNVPSWNLAFSKPVAIVPNVAHTITVEWGRVGLNTTPVLCQPATEPNSQHYTVSVIMY